MTEHQWLELTRWTARVGVILFAMFYVTRRRMPWLVSFAFTHTVHLVALTTYLIMSSEHRSVVTVAVGGLGYAAIYAVAVLPSWENRWVLRVVAPHLILTIFAFSYLGRAFDADRRAVGLFGCAVLALALAARLTSVRKAGLGPQKGKKYVSAGVHMSGPSDR